MSFNVGIIISNDCSKKIIRKLTTVYNLPLKKVNNSTIQSQLGENEFLYMMIPYDAYYWSYAMPLNGQQWIERVEKMSIKYENASTYEDKIMKIEAELEGKGQRRQMTFEAQMMAGIIRYLKLKCNIQSVGLLGCMMCAKPNQFKFPTFPQKRVSIKDTSGDTIMRIDEECIYYFD